MEKWQQQLVEHSRPASANGLGESGFSCHDSVVFGPQQEL